MLTIRLQRRGRKNDPSFRVILVEKKRAAKTGQFMEVLGSYDARTGRTELKAERIKEWMSKGVTISDNLHNILVNKKVIDAKKINILPKKTVPKKEGEDAPQAVAAPAEAPAAAPIAEEAAPEAPAAEGDNTVAA